MYIYLSLKLYNDKITCTAQEGYKVLIQNILNNELIVNQIQGLCAFLCILYTNHHNLYEVSVSFNTCNASNASSDLIWFSAIFGYPKYFKSH